MNQTLTIFREPFEDDLHLLRNPACLNCDPEIKHPLLPWLVGRDFHKTKEKIVFVGKPHRGAPGDVLDSGILDPTSCVGGSNGLWHHSWAYWRYTKEIADRLYNGNGFNSIVFTNSIKCTNTDSLDATTPLMAQMCISELGVIWREFEIIKPLTAIFYTYNLYPELLRSIPIAIPGTVKEITPYGYRIPCGKKQLGWWERSCKTSWAENFRILVIGHPERMKKVDFINHVIQWVSRDSDA